MLTPDGVGMVTVFKLAVELATTCDGDVPKVMVVLFPDDPTGTKTDLSGSWRRG